MVPNRACVQRLPAVPERKSLQDTQLSSLPGKRSVT